MSRKLFDWLRSAAASEATDARREATVATVLANAYQTIEDEDEDEDEYQDGIADGCQVADTTITAAPGAMVADTDQEVRAC